ncbi:MAG TPA: hypothetical protein VF590_25025, partial [Isosphaeraceae bacterium]
MPLAIPLTVLLALATPLQAPADDRAAAAVAPVLGDEVAVVVHLNLMTWDARATLRSVLGELADEELVRSATKAAGAWADALKRAGARDLFVLIDLADMPGLPVAAVPLAGGADGAAIARVLSGGGLDAPVRWPAVETIRGAVIAGTPEAVARIRAAEPGERPEVAAALAAGGEAPVRVAIAPTPTLRRALEESVA